MIWDATHAHYNVIVVLMNINDNQSRYVIHKGLVSPYLEVIFLSNNHYFHNGRRNVDIFLTNNEI